MNELFKTIGSPRTLSQKVVKSIQDNILNRRLLPGQKLPTEKELCQMFGVSRTALREALQALSARGLVTIRKGSGIYVNNLTESDASKNMSLYLEINFDKAYALHLVQVRQIIEPENARLAAQNRTDEDLQDLEKNLAEFARDDISAERHAQLDLEFHKQIAEATGNPLLSLLLTPLYNLMPRIKAMIVEKVRHNKVQDPLGCHQKIYHHIKSGNPTEAFTAMSEHLKIAEADTFQLIKALKNKQTS